MCPCHAHYWAGERERDVALPTMHSLRVHWTHLLCSIRVSLSRFPRAFSLFLLIAVSCVVFLCLFLLHLHHFAVLALLFRSQLVAIVPLSSSRLDSIRPSFRYGFQFRPEAPAQSSRTYAKLWFHLTNGQAINHKIKKTQVLANRKRRRLSNGSVWALAWPKGNNPMGQRLGESNSQIKRDLICLFASLSISVLHSYYNAQWAR